MMEHYSLKADMVLSKSSEICVWHLQQEERSQTLGVILITNKPLLYSDTLIQQDHKYSNKVSPPNITTPLVDHLSFKPTHSLGYKVSLGILDFYVLAESMGAIFILKKNINFLNSSQILNTYHDTSIILVSRTLISFYILVDQGQILNLNTFHMASLILVYQTVISFHILVVHELRQR